MNKETYYDGDYEINQVNYGGKYGGDDTVCQVKKFGKEVGHCTWHPGCDVQRHGDCPYYLKEYCLDK